jgi:hypothetical protein
VDGRREQVFHVQFDAKLKVRLRGARITSGAGIAASCELVEAFCLTDPGSMVLANQRHGENTWHTMLAMTRQSIYERLTGGENVIDAERLRIGVLDELVRDGDLLQRRSSCR